MSAVLYGGPPDLGTGRPWPVLPTEDVPTTAPVVWPQLAVTLADDLDAAAKRLLKVSVDPRSNLSGESRSALDATVGELLQLAASLRGSP